MIPKIKGRTGPRAGASSHVTFHRYDPENRTLDVTFHGDRKYRYHDVDPVIASGIDKAPSKGGYLHRHIIGKHDVTQIVSQR